MDPGDSSLQPPARVASKTWAHSLRASESFTIFAVAVAMFVDSFIYSMIVPIIPKRLVDYSNLPETEVQKWVAILLAAYGAALLLGALVFGYISDHSSSRKAPFFAGLISMAGAIVLFVISTSPVVLVVARLLQGLAAGAVWVAGLALIANRVSKDRIGAAMGHTTVGMTWGGLLGPFSGAIYDKFGYYAAFAIPIVLLFLDLILRSAVIESTDPRSPRSRTTYNTFSGSQSEDSPCLEDSPSLEDDCETRSLLKRKLKRKIHPILRLIVNPHLLVITLETAVAAAILASFEATLPLFVMQHFGWSSTGAGLIFLALTIPCTAGILIGKIADRTGTEIFSTLAFFLAAPAIFSLRFVVGITALDVLLLIGLLGVTGLAVIAIEVVTMADVFYIVDEAETRSPGIFGPNGAIAQAYAILNIAFASGQFLGPLAAGMLKERFGWQGMTLGLALFCIPVGIFVGWFNWYKQVDSHDEHHN
ncbi:hypothetical protein FQN57_007313 [Myotisia sp. PD_48]|nr:hypothetical protein FQN57_007313 [Myotisia sp. PD_48]